MSSILSSLRNIFMRPDYRSETTQFIDGLKSKEPDLEARQRAGRALLWDKNVDRSAWAEYREAQVAQQPYVYQTQTK
jgi:predicted phage gp36 major capsid-like protein